MTQNIEELPEPDDHRPQTFAELCPLIYYAVPARNKMSLINDGILPMEAGFLSGQPTPAYIGAGEALRMGLQRCKALGDDELFILEFATRDLEPEKLLMTWKPPLSVDHPTQISVNAAMAPAEMAAQIGAGVRGSRCFYTDFILPSHFLSHVTIPVSEAQQIVDEIRSDETDPDIYFRAALDWIFYTKRLSINTFRADLN